MDRVIDEIILAALCLLLLPLTAFAGAHVAALLGAIAVACCFNLYPRSAFRWIAAGAFLLGTLFVPEFALFLPLVAYVLFGERFMPARFVWVIPLAAALRTQDGLLVGTVAMLCVAADLMAWRTERMADERERYRALRDDQQETALSLARKNRELMAAQDYEVRLATLSERSRIAREIHDNVGHLLTRSLLQVEALQVVHADDESVRDELASVGATLHDAMDTVRRSVHDLHDDAFDLRARLEGVIDACGLDGVRLVYDAQDVPLPVAYSLVAVVREALSNVAKHSDATRVEVSVIEYPALYQLMIQDNGTRDLGLGSLGRCAASDEGAVSGGIGLQTMEERVNALGGRLLTGYRKGFRVFATIPKEKS